MLRNDYSPSIVNNKDRTKETMHFFLAEAASGSKPVEFNDSLSTRQ